MVQNAKRFYFAKQKRKIRNYNAIIIIIVIIWQNVENENEKLINKSCYKLSYYSKRDRFNRLRSMSIRRKIIRSINIDIFICVKIIKLIVK